MSATEHLGFRSTTQTRAGYSASADRSMIAPAPLFLTVKPIRPFGAALRGSAHENSVATSQESTRGSGNSTGRTSLSPLSAAKLRSNAPRVPVRNCSANGPPEGSSASAMCSNASRWRKELPENPPRLRRLRLMIGNSSGPDLAHFSAHALADHGWCRGRVGARRVVGQRR